MAFINIGGMDLPTPSTYSNVLQDLDSDSTKRNEQGILQRDRIRQGIRKINCKWNAVSFEDAALILGAVSPDSVQVSYPDPQAGGWQSAVMYVGDRTNDMVQTQDGQKWNISFDLIEY